MSGCWDGQVGPRPPPTTQSPTASTSASRATYLNTGILCVHIRLHRVFSTTDLFPCCFYNLWVCEGCKKLQNNRSMVHIDRSFSWCFYVICTPNYTIKRYWKKEAKEIIFFHLHQTDRQQTIHRERFAPKWVLLFNLDQAAILTSLETTAQTHSRNTINQMLGSVKFSQIFYISRLIFWLDLKDQFI